MCLIAFAHRVHPAYPLVVAANRDEFYGRPTAAAAFWEDHPRILGGRDLEAMGTWLGVSRNGRFAAVTNFRDPAEMRTKALSRGELASRFLAGDEPAEAYLRQVAMRAADYRGFNLLLADGAEFFSYSNRSGQVTRLEPGIYGLSNHLLNTPWPKVRIARKRLADALDPAPASETLFALLDDTSVALDDELPQAGVSEERERMLSAARVVSDTYGTRSSTVVVRDAEGTLRFAERTFGPAGAELDTASFEFRIER